MIRTLYKNNRQLKSTDKDFNYVEYSIDGNKFFQEELSYDDMTEVMNILKSDVAKAVENKNPLDAINTFDMLDVNIGAGNIKKILSIAIKRDASKIRAPRVRERIEQESIDISKMKASHVRQMADDFFFLNPELSNSLSSLANSAATVMMISSFRNIENTLKNLPRVSPLQKKKSTSRSQRVISKSSANSKKNPDK